MYDLAVYIGRFQPFHKGHEYVINEGLKNAKNVLVLVGSAYASRSIKNPFTWNEREFMIRSSIKSDRVFIEPLPDYTYEENQWIAEVQSIVHDVCDNLNIKTVCIIGHDKDDSSYYLKSFKWPIVTLDHWEPILNASDIRKIYFSVLSPLYLVDVLPEKTREFLTDFKTTAEYNELVDEFKFIDDYRSKWENAPYVPTFNTVDAIVVQSGHILLIRRNEQPGKYLWALPGGFVNPNETLQKSVIRELREETKLKVPVKILEKSIERVMTFDNPNRSMRGRTITQVFYIQLEDELDLPRVKGSDDAYHAEWIPLVDFYEMEPIMFEDHYHIVRKMIDNR